MPLDFFKGNLTKIQEETDSEDIRANNRDNKT